MKRSEFVNLMGIYMTPGGRGDLVIDHGLRARIDEALRGEEP